MERIRIGKDIHVHWTIKTDGHDVPLAGRDLTIVLQNSFKSKEIEGWEIYEGNTINFVIPGISQQYLGKYILTLWENKGQSGQCVLDTCAFELVARTWNENEHVCDDIATPTLKLEGELQYGGRVYDVLVNGVSVLVDGIAYIDCYTRAEVDAKIADVRKDIVEDENVLAEALHELQNNIDSEAEAREAADTTLQNNIDSEAEARETADTTLQGNIDSEAEARETADTTLQGNIDSEAEAREAADTTLQNNIDSEAEARETADTTLQGNIDSEAEAREAADTTLQGNIDSEAEARETADTTLQGNIDSEAEAREAADTTLQNNIDSEAEARETADTTLQGNIDSEAEAREAADTTLQNNIDSEAERAGQAEQGLQNGINTINSKIPSTATSTNQLADKDFVNSSINSVTAYYITKDAQGTQFASKADLDATTTFYSGGEVRVPTRNDYCIIIEDETRTDPVTGEKPTTRYIYQTSGWEFQYIVNKTALTAAQLAALNSGLSAQSKETYDEHIANKNNPHAVTKEQVGLGKVPNVETNNQTPTYTEASELTALSSGEVLSIAFGKIKKAVSTLIAHLSANNPHNITKSTIGLGNVDNTSDTNKPVSTATQNALNAKVDKVTGKGLSANDYTTTEKNKLGALPTATELNTTLSGKQPKVTTSDDTSALGDSTKVAINFTDSKNIVFSTALKVFNYIKSKLPQWATADTKPTYTKSEVGLGNVDNTSDIDKPISDETKTELQNDEQVTAEALHELKSGMASTVSSTQVRTIVVLTQSEYDALTSYDAYTEYNIIEN